MNKKIIAGIISVLVVLIIAGIYVDRHPQKAAQSFGGAQNEVTKNVATGQPVDLKNYGHAPEFAGIDRWLNSDPLTIGALKGKVVLVDFWTYSCINCIRTLPYVTKWYDAYKDKGFVVVGVHTPEFAFEKDYQNVRDAIERFGIHYPVAQDNNFQTWNAYSNQYWPAEYLINKDGDVVYTHFGEGNYDHTENAIRSLLGMDMVEGNTTAVPFENVQSPEMYFGTDRLANVSSEQTPSSSKKTYTLPSTQPLNTFALAGDWQFTTKSVRLVGSHGTIRLHFSAGKVHLVASSSKNVTLSIVVDDIKQKSVTVKESELYTLFDSKEYTDHTIEITIDGEGFEAYTFTFG